MTEQSTALTTTEQNAVVSVATNEEVVKQPSFLESILPFVMIMVVFYFFIIRPQSKKIKEHQDLLGGLQKGQEVLTSGGLFGTITDIQDHILFLTISEGVKVKVKRDMVVEVVATKEVKSKVAATNKKVNKKDKSK